MAQATRPDGAKRWWVYVRAWGVATDLNLRKTLWAPTPQGARARAERLGYNVARVEPAPPASF